MSSYDSDVHYEAEVKALREKLHELQYVVWMVCKRIKESTERGDLSHFQAVTLSELHQLETELTSRKTGKLE